MSSGKNWRTQLAGRYWVWRLYHFLVADAVAVQKPTKDKMIYEFLGEHLGRVADIGCGPGVFTRYLCAHADRVCAADIDAASLGRVRARNRAELNLDSLVTDAGKLPFADSQLDTVLFLEVLEHLPDDAAALSEVHRVLAPGGRVVLSVPVPPGEINEGEAWGHKREGYQLEEIVALVERNGFRVEKRGFAVFRFSRLSNTLIRNWRHWLRLPAPIFLAWVSYFDCLLNAKGRQKGAYLPASVVLLARKL